MVGHGGSSASLYLADPTSPIPSHCASIVTTSTVRVNLARHGANPFSLFSLVINGKQMQLPVHYNSDYRTNTLAAFVGNRALCGLLW